VRVVSVFYALALVFIGVENGVTCSGLQFAVNDLFQLVQQFLSTANAEGRNQYGALILQRMFDDGFEALTAIGTVLVQAVAVGAFKHEDIGSLG
jgi:hypothetical protein